MKPIAVESQLTIEVMTTTSSSWLLSFLPWLSISSTTDFNTAFIIMLLENASMNANPLWGEPEEVLLKGEVLFNFLIISLSECYIILNHCMNYSLWCLHMQCVKPYSVN